MGEGQLQPLVPVRTFSPLAARACSLPGWGGPGRLGQSGSHDTGCLLFFTLAELLSSNVDFGLPPFPTHPERPGRNILEHASSLETLPLGSSICPGPSCLPRPT